MKDLTIIAKFRSYKTKNSRASLSNAIIFITMLDLSQAEEHIQCVTNFQDLVRTPFNGEINAICWTRELAGDFSEIVNKIAPSGNITEVTPEELLALQLSEQGQLARAILLNDFDMLTAYGALPTLNIISHYDRDDSRPFFPTDVYSFHVDRSPVPTDTLLCTYYGDASEILPNSQGEKKILVPEIRDGLKKLYDGPAEGFETFLSDHFFDLHYAAKPGARPISLGLGTLCRLAIDHPESRVPPCIHRAPRERSGRNRLLMIC